MARDQRLVGRGKVELQTTPDAVVVVLADAAFDEGRAHDAAAERARKLRAQRQRVLASEITMADITAEIVVEVILEIHLVEEARLDVEGGGKRIRGRDRATRNAGLEQADIGVRARVAEFDAGDALEREGAPVELPLAADVVDVDAAQAIPQA